MQHSIVSTAPVKARIYEQLNNLNQGFEQVIRSLDALEQAGLMAADIARACQDRAEELRAEINRMLAEALSQMEADDAKHFEQQRLRREQRLSGSDTAPRA